jgi:hypothetical protein
MRDREPDGTILWDRDMVKAHGGLRKDQRALKALAIRLKGAAVCFRWTIAGLLECCRLF